MQNKKISKIYKGLWLFSCLFCFAHIIYFTVNMPAEAFININFSGRPSDLMPKIFSVIFYFLMYLSLNGLFFLIFRLSENMRLAGSSVEEFFNIPNSDFWFLPENRLELVHRTKLIFCKIAVASNFFLIGVFQLVYLANLNPKTKAGAFILPMVIVLLIYTTLVVISSFQVNKS